MIIVRLLLTNRSYVRLRHSRVVCAVSGGSIYRLSDDAFCIYNRLIIPPFLKLGLNPPNSIPHSDPDSCQDGRDRESTHRQRLVFDAHQAPIGAHRNVPNLMGVGRILTELCSWYIRAPWGGGFETAEVICYRSHTCPGPNARKRSGGISAASKASARAMMGASNGSSVSWKVP